MIKNHKPKKGGEYPTRLVVPASKFTAGFANLGYCGIKFIFDKFGINYSRFYIVQVSDVKGKLEEINVRWNFHTIVSFDAIDVYPSIKFEMVQRAVNFYASSLNPQEQAQIESCLWPI